MGQHLPADILPRVRIWLGGILLLAVIHGLIYVAIIPPWQHYDEPGQFEYAWLLANWGRKPEVGEYDQGMRREVAASMIEHDFFAGMEKLPNLMSQTEPIWIGISQASDPPIYYWFASLPLQLVKTSDITFQLYLVRLVSLAFYVVTIFIAYLIVAELTPPNSHLRWLVPLSIVMLPGFTDLMTAVNNDVGAVAFFSLFLWLSVRSIRRAGDWLSLAGMLVLAIVCFFVKNTVMVAVPLALFGLLFSLLRGRWRVIAWGAIIFLVVVAALLTLRWNGAKAWYTQGIGGTFTSRSIDEKDPLESNLTQFDLAIPSASQVIQPISPQRTAELRGKQVTIGAWVWATHPMKAYTPILWDGRNSYYQVIEIDTTPTFYSYVVQVLENSDRLLITLKAPATVKDGIIYYDGLVMVQGNYPGFSLADFRSGGQTIEWEGSSLINLIRNPSFEQAWPRFLPRMDKQLTKWLPYEPSQILTSFSDLDGSGWYYQETFENMFRTFWAKFGWGHILLEGHKPYRVLLAATVLGILGAMAASVRLRRSLEIELLAFISISIAILWAAAVTRGINSLIGTIFIPGARYGYPAIVFTFFLLCIGWKEILQKFSQWFHIPMIVPYSVYFSLFLLLDSLSIYTILQYYSHLP